MLNLTGMVRAPNYDWEVTMHRCNTANEAQNARRKIAYVVAPNEHDAKKEAKRKNPAFHPVSVRRVTIGTASR